MSDSAAPIRWGFIGAGGIAHKLATDIALTEGNVVIAVAARDGDRAAKFASAHGIERSYGSYEQLVADDGVDVVYIATTHPHHKAQALLAIEAGKSLLIEKPVCLNAADAGEVFRAATAAGVFAMEAMWMRMNPLLLRAEELVTEGAIGRVSGAHFEFGLGVPFNPNHRLFDLANGGGALLDLGIYPMTFAYHFFGRPDVVHTAGSLSPTGSDDTVAMQWDYEAGQQAQLWCSATVCAPNEAEIVGTNGWIKFLPMAHRTSGLIVRSGDREFRIADPIEGQGFGYGPQVLEVERCLRAGLTESPKVPWADTIAILEILDQARATLGIVYPSEM